MDKGTIEQLKTSVGVIYNNAQSDGFLTPQKHSNMIDDVIDTLAPSYGSAMLNIANEYCVDMSVTQVAYSGHKLYILTFDVTNTGAIVLNVDSLGNIPVKDSLLNELVANDIVVGKIYELRYNSDNSVFIIR